jgi:hypothetical protein
MTLIAQQTHFTLTVTVNKKERALLREIFADKSEAGGLELNYVRLPNDADHEVLEAVGAARLVLKGRTATLAFEPYDGDGGDPEFVAEVLEAWLTGTGRTGSIMLTCAYWRKIKAGRRCIDQYGGCVYDISAHSPLVIVDTQDWADAHGGREGGRHG